jgi:hypothetical protein
MDKKIIEYHCLKWDKEKCEQQYQKQCSYAKEGFIDHFPSLYEARYNHGTFIIYINEGIKPCGEGIYKDGNILLYYMLKTKYKNKG